MKGQERERAGLYRKDGCRGMWFTNDGPAFFLKEIEGIPCDGAPVLITTGEVFALVVHDESGRAWVERATDPQLGPVESIHDHL